MCTYFQINFLKEKIVFPEALLPAVSSIIPDVIKISFRLVESEVNIHITEKPNRKKLSIPYEYHF